MIHGLVETKIINGEGKTTLETKGNNTVVKNLKWQLYQTLLNPYYWDSLWYKTSSSNSNPDGSNQGYSYGFNPTSQEGKTYYQAGPLYPNPRLASGSHVSSDAYKRNHFQKIPKWTYDHENNGADQSTTEGVDLVTHQNDTSKPGCQIIPTDLGGSSAEFTNTWITNETFGDTDAPNYGLRCVLETTDDELCVMGDIHDYNHQNGYQNLNSGAHKNARVAWDANNPTDVHLITKHGIKGPACTYRKAWLGIPTYMDSNGNNGKGHVGFTTPTSDENHYGTKGAQALSGHTSETVDRKMFWTWAEYDFNDVTVTANDTFIIKWIIGF